MGNLVISQPPISSAFSLWQSSLPSPNLPFSGGTPATRRVSFGGAIPPLTKEGKHTCPAPGGTSREPGWACPVLNGKKQEPYRPIKRLTGLSPPSQWAGRLDKEGKEGWSYKPNALIRTLM